MHLQRVAASLPFSGQGHSTVSMLRRQTQPVAQLMVPIPTGVKTSLTSLGAWGELEDHWSPAQFSLKGLPTQLLLHRSLKGTCMYKFPSPSPPDHFHAVGDPIMMQIFYSKCKMVVTMDKNIQLSSRTIMLGPYTHPKGPH